MKQISSKTISLIYNIIIVIGIIFILIIIFIGKNMESNLMNNQAHVNEKTGNWNAATTAYETSQIGPRRTYWLIPKEKNPNGGWDSISGWWDGETPTRHLENPEIYNYEFSKF